MGWGVPRRPKISNKLNIPHPREGSDGDIQIRQTNLGAKLFGKIGGRWNSTFLSSEDQVIGTSGTKIGMDSSGAFTVNEILLTGKITLTSTGTQNVVIGTGNNDIGTDNIVIGVGAGAALTAGSISNTIIGSSAGAALDTGDENVCIGKLAGTSMEDGDKNVCIGFGAGQGIVDSDFNVAIGRNANNSGTGPSNVVIGNGAGNDLAISTDGVIIGTIAGLTNETGYGVTCLGAYTDTSIADGDDEIVIGYQATGQGNHYAVIGRAQVTNIYMAEDKGAKVWCTNIDSSSDRRIKKNIQASPLGLDFVNQLNPVLFNMRKYDEWDADLLAKQPRSKKPEIYEKKNSSPRDIDDQEVKIGFIAQEVKAALGDVECDIHLECGVDCIESLDYSRFVVPLTKAVQELSAKLDTMQTEINNLKAE